jgi:hypothetical protein
MGAIADAHGVAATIVTAGALSVVAAAIAFTLPGERRAIDARATTPAASA